MLLSPFVFQSFIRIALCWTWYQNNINYFFKCNIHFSFQGRACWKAGRSLDNRELARANIYQRCFAALRPLLFSAWLVTSLGMQAGTQRADMTVFCGWTLIQLKWIWKWLYVFVRMLLICWVESRSKCNFMTHYQQGNHKRLNNHCIYSRTRQYWLCGQISIQFGNKQRNARNDIHILCFHVVIKLYHQ